MSHRDLEAQLDAYLDGELTGVDARELEAHLARCGECTRFRDGRLALRAALQAAAPALQPPETLRQRLRTALREDAAAPLPTPSRFGLPVRWRLLAVAASLAVVALGSRQLGLRRATSDTISDAVLESHIRSLMPGHLTDVLSSDRHTVKPWFNGRLDFSPPVYDFAGQGYPLIGGRLDYVGGRPVAGLVYGRRQHLISVVLWPARRGPAAGNATETRQGYHLLHWTTPDYAYWVVSDLGLVELRDFAQLLQRGDSVAKRVTAAPGVR